MNTSIHYLITGRLNDAGARSLSNFMKEHSYSKKTSVGFYKRRSRNGYIRAEYIEKKSRSVEFNDPISGKITYKVVEILSTDFSISRQDQLMALYNPSRNFSSCITKVGEGLDFSIPIEPPSINCLEWSEGIAAVVDDMRITSISLNPITVSSHVSSSISLKSNYGIEVPIDVRRVVGQKDWNPKSCSISFVVQGKRKSVILSDSARAKSSNLDIDELDGIIRSPLLAITRKSNSND